MSTACILVFAMLLDAALGEPPWVWRRLPHPAVLMGRLISWADVQFNKDSARQAKGIVLVAGLVLGGWLLGVVLSAFGWVVEILIVAVLLAQRSLVSHVQAVGDALRVSLGDGRRAVGQIVSRDTGELDETAVARSAIESGAENLSDGVIAPAFWFLIAGLPGLLIYKVINTADSMIGYRTERYSDFGWAAARLDDVLNWVPARISAALIALVHLGLRDWKAIRTDASLHRSPNAGWPESAMARALNVAVSGPRSYGGQLRDFPYVNEFGRRTLGPDDVDAACRALWLSWSAALCIVLVFSLL